MICADNWITREIKFIQSWLYYFMTASHTVVLQPQFLSFPPAVFHSKLKNASPYSYLICLPTKAAVLESILKPSRELSTNGKCLRNFPNLLKTCWKLNPHWKKKNKKTRIKGRKRINREEKNHFFHVLLLKLRAYISKVGQWDCGWLFVLKAGQLVFPSLPPPFCLSPQSKANQQKKKKLFIADG